MEKRADAVDVAAAGGAVNAPESSSVREAFQLMTALIYPKIPVPFLDLSAKILQRRHLETVFEERSVQRLCGFPACGNRLSEKKGKFRVSLARREIYDAHHENQFCSPQCEQKARVLLSKLVSKPPQLVPSMLEVFGTDKPNPLDYDSASVLNSGVGVKKHSTEHPAPGAKTVWAKTSDLGIVERKPSANPMTELAVPATLEAAAGDRLKEKTQIPPPDREFPDAKHAVLIEGFMFPSHKQKLAKKVERLLQKEENKDAAEVVVSDSDESESGSEYGSSDVSSTGSFVLSDFDEDEVISLSELPLFSNLWSLFSEWITHETTLVVAGAPLPAKMDPSGAERTPGDVKDEAAERRARQVFNERWNSLSLMMRRPMVQIALKLRLANDRQSNYRIDSITRTFSLRTAIDTRNTHLWTCVATVLMLVAHNKRPSDIRDEEWSDRVKALTKLDAHELRQLLELFYDVRNDSDIAIDTDTAPLPEKTDSSAHGKPKDTKTDPICRKCRRPSSKCICSSRAKEGKKEFSTAEVESMLQEALVLRDEYEELLQA